VQKTNKTKIHTAFAFSTEFACILHLLSTVAAVSEVRCSLPRPWLTGPERCISPADLPPLPGAEAAGAGGGLQQTRARLQVSWVEHLGPSKY